MAVSASTTFYNYDNLESDSTTTTPCYTISPIFQLPISEADKAKKKKKDDKMRLKLNRRNMFTKKGKY